MANPVYLEVLMEKPIYKCGIFHCHAWLPEDDDDVDDDDDDEMMMEHGGTWWIVFGLGNYKLWFWCAYEKILLAIRLSLHWNIESSQHNSHCSADLWGSSDILKSLSQNSMLLPPPSSVPPFWHFLGCEQPSSGEQIVFNFHLWLILQ